MTAPRVRAAGPTLFSPVATGEGTEVPSPAQVNELYRLMQPIPAGLLFAVAIAHHSQDVWCELRRGAQGRVARADYTRARVLELGDAWPAEAAKQLRAALA